MKVWYRRSQMRRIILIPLKLRVSLSLPDVQVLHSAFLFIVTKISRLQALRQLIRSAGRCLPRKPSQFHGQHISFPSPHTAVLLLPKPSNYLPSLALSTCRTKHPSSIYSITCPHRLDAALHYICLSPSLKHFFFAGSWINRRRRGCAARHSSFFCPRILSSRCL
ncbi:hypothetical protein EI94DRAFT_675495 [Lactarius quietus]|nr:hypothetical protein EI94DRAFT_675495 [Lactarius quietus]